MYDLSKVSQFLKLYQEQVGERGDENSVFLKLKGKWREGKESVSVDVFSVESGNTNSPFFFTLRSLKILSS